MVVWTQYWKSGAAVSWWLALTKSGGDNLDSPQDWEGKLCNAPVRSRVRLASLAFDLMAVLLSLVQRMCSDKHTADEHPPIRLTIWSEANPASVVEAVKSGLAARSVSADVHANHLFFLQHFGLYHEICAVIRPLPVGVGVDIDKRTIDVLADLQKERFRPKQAGITHTIFIFGPYGAVLRCLEVRNKKQKDITKE